MPRTNKIVEVACDLCGWSKNYNSKNYNRDDADMEDQIASRFVRVQVAPGACKVADKYLCPECATLVMEAGRKAREERQSREITLGAKLGS